MMKYNYDDDTNNIILPTAGRLHDPQHEKGQEWCKRLPPPRFYILLFLLLSSTLLLLPGGQMNPDILRMNERAVAIVREFDMAGKPIAAICHAPWLLAEADLVKGKTVTSWPSIRTDLKNAGANVVDEEAAVDGNLITSRNPDDIPAFSKALIEMLGKTVEKRELEAA